MTTSLDKTLERGLEQLSEAAPLVMVVQPDRDERLALCDLLELDGYRVVEAQNGHLALQQLRSGAELPRLLIAELDGSLISGAELLRTLQKTPVLCRITCLLIANRRDIETEAKRLGAVAGLEKPISDELALKTVGWLTGRNVAR